MHSAHEIRPKQNNFQSDGIQHLARLNIIYDCTLLYTIYRDFKKPPLNFIGKFQTRTIKCHSSVLKEILGLYESKFWE